MPIRVYKRRATNPAGPVLGLRKPLSANRLKALLAR
jgi:hypothetical protein